MVAALSEHQQQFREQRLRVEVPLAGFAVDVRDCGASEAETVIVVFDFCERGPADGSRIEGIEDKAGPETGQVGAAGIGDHHRLMTMANRQQEVIDCLGLAGACAPGDEEVFALIGGMEIDAAEIEQECSGLIFFGVGTEATAEPRKTSCPPEAGTSVTRRRLRLSRPNGKGRSSSHRIQEERIYSWLGDRRAGSSPGLLFSHCAYALSWLNRYANDWSTT